MPVTASSDLASIKRLRCSLELFAGLESEIITVRVGAKTTKGQRDFSVHKTLLTDASPFFANALNGDWKESEQNLVELEDTLPDNFKIYLGWIYMGRIGAKGAAEQKTANKQGSFDNPELARMESCLELGDLLQDHDFTDAIVDANFELVESDDLVCLSLPACLHKNFGQQSPYGKLALEYVEGNLSHIHDFLRFGRDETEFLVDVATRTAEIASGQRAKSASTFRQTFKQNPCQYHLHTRDGKPCYRTRLA